MAEPMASALRRAAEVAGKSEFDAAAPRPAAAPQGGTHGGAAKAGLSQAGLSQTGLSQARTGAAAAPARAKEIPAPAAKQLALEPTASAISAPPKEEIQEVKRIEDPSAGDGWDSNSATAAAEAPSFAGLEGGQQASDAGGSKKTLLIAVVVIGLAAAGYFGWTKMQPAQSQPAVQQSAAPASSGTTALPPQPTSSVPDAQPRNWPSRCATDGAGFEWRNFDSNSVEAFRRGVSGSSWKQDSSPGQGDRGK